MLLQVVSNAIRCIGHLGSYLLYVQTATDTLVDHDHHFIFHDAIVTTLCSKVDASIVASRGRATWKERSSAKKHGWGACHSLGVLLSHYKKKKKKKRLANQDGIETDAVSQRAVSCLVACLEHGLELNEKVLLSALQALIGTPASTLEALSEPTLMNGRAVGHCLTEGFKVRVLRSCRISG